MSRGYSNPLSFIIIMEINKQTQEKVKDSGNTKSLKCCLCGEKIEKELSGWDEGHNAEPLRKGRCCEDCNATKVIPIRLMELN